MGQAFSKGYDRIFAKGTPLPRRAKVNFSGSALTLWGDAAGRTELEFDGGGGGIGSFTDIEPIQSDPTHFDAGVDLSVADIYRDSSLVRRVVAFTGAGNEAIVTGTTFVLSEPVTLATWLFVRAWSAPATSFTDVDPSPLAAEPTDQWDAGVALTKADIYLDSSFMRRVLVFTGAGNEVIVTGNHFQTSAPIDRTSAWLFARVWT